MQDVSNFNNIGPTISIQVLNLHDFFIEFGGDFQIIFRTLMEILYVGTLVLF